MYKLTDTTTIIRIADKSSIPNDPANTDYANYLEWLEEGNKPEPADKPIPPTYQELRRSEYNKLNQDEMRFDDLINGTTTWVDSIKAIKAKYPKE